MLLIDCLVKPGPEGLGNCVEIHVLQAFGEARGQNIIGIFTGKCSKFPFYDSSWFLLK